MISGRGRCLIVLIAVLAMGCGGSHSASRKPTHKVTGSVVMAGAPVIGAFVVFSPKQLGQPAATGRTDDSGKFILTTYDTGDGAAAGDYAVLVSKTAAKEATGAVASHEAIASGKVKPGAAHSTGGKSTSAAKSESGLPDKYSDLAATPLNATVKAGEANVFDLKLEL
jgi:hypothetical protein